MPPTLGALFIGSLSKIGIYSVAIFGNTVYSIAIYGIMQKSQTIYCRFVEFCVENYGNINVVDWGYYYI